MSLSVVPVSVPRAWGEEARDSTEVEEDGNEGSLSRWRVEHSGGGCGAGREGMAGTTRAYVPSGGQPDVPLRDWVQRDVAVVEGPSRSRPGSPFSSLVTQT